MFELFAIALVLALPSLAILVVLTVLTPSVVWVVGPIAMTGSVLGGFWIWLWMIRQAELGTGHLAAGYFAGAIGMAVLTMAYAIAVLTFVAFRICYQTRASALGGP